MFERLDQIEARYEELTQALASPDIIGDSSKYQKTAKAHSEIFDKIRPAATFIEIKNLRVPKARVEIEFTAVID